MVSADLKKLLDNFDAEQIEVIETIAARLAWLKVEAYTGEISFTLHANQGGFGEIQVHRREVVRLKRRGRTVRSGGIR